MRNNIFEITVKLFLTNKPIKIHSNVTFKKLVHIKEISAFCACKIQQAFIISFLGQLFL